MFGEVTESAETGDILSASANQDSHPDRYQRKDRRLCHRHGGPTGNTEAWIYGLDADLDEITVTGGFDEVPGTITTHELADGQTIQKVSYEGTDAILDLYFADGGNVDSTFLDDKIKFES